MVPFELSMIEKIRGILDIEDGILSNKFLERVEEIKRDADRYEKVRKMNPHQFRKIWNKEIEGEKQFDSLIDELPLHGR